MKKFIKRLKTMKFTEFQCVCLDAIQALVVVLIVLLLVAIGISSIPTHEPSIKPQNSKIQTKTNIKWMEAIKEKMVPVFSYVVMEDYIGEDAEYVLEQFPIEARKKIEFTEDGKRNLKHTELSGFRIKEQSIEKDKTWLYYMIPLKFTLEKDEIFLKSSSQISGESDGTILNKGNQFGISTSLGISKEIQTNGRILWVGDSRFVGISQIADSQSDKDVFIAKTSMGLSWFLEEGLDQVEANYQEGDTIVFNLGVNDIAFAPRYVETLNNLMNTTWKGRRVIYVSVNPIEDGKAISNGYQVSNKDIEVFFGNIKEQLHEDIEYLDTYHRLIPILAQSTFDGIHYTNEANSQIYHWIRDYVEGKA